MSKKRILLLIFLIISILILVYPIKQFTYFLKLEYNSSKVGENTKLSCNKYISKLDTLIKKYGYSQEEFDDADNIYGFDIKVDNDLLVSISNWYDVEYIEIHSLNTKKLITEKDRKKIGFIAEAYNMFAVHKISINDIQDYIDSLIITDSGDVSGKMKKLTLSNKIYFYVLDNQFYLQGITK